jgi:acyl-CoA reductase-like NAD-dependent aldehyde dehydrogenase
VKADMRIYEEEIFGPVLCIVRVNTLEEAVQFINRNPNVKKLTVKCTAVQCNVS